VVVSDSYGCGSADTEGRPGVIGGVTVSEPYLADDSEVVESHGSSERPASDSAVTVRRV
jgi:hypothetical protein